MPEISADQVNTAIMLGAFLVAAIGIGMFIHDVGKQVLAKKAIEHSRELHAL